MSLRTLAVGAAAVLALAAPLAGCGKLGQLEKPGSLKGAQAGEGPRPAVDPQRTMETVDPRDRASDPAPPIAEPAPPTPPSTPQR